MCVCVCVFVIVIKSKGTKKSKKKPCFPNYVAYLYANSEKKSGESTILGEIILKINVCREWKRV